jgi:hypothetical protein
MNEKASARLRLIGFAVVVVTVVLLWLPMMAHNQIKYDDAIARTLAIGIGLLLLAEVGPLVKSLKAGGIEVEFLDTVTDKFNALDARLAALEMHARHPERHPGGRKSEGAPAAPALDRPITDKEDPQKGRFGGQAERDGFKLSASFRNVTKSFVEVVLRVEAPPGAGLEEAECVEFFLHDSFDPDVIPAVFSGGVAELALLVYGGFTVGAWVGCRRVELELDLAKIKGAPRLIRDN